MSPSEELVGPYGTAYTSGLVDRVTKVQGAYFNTPTAQGATDDGDTAYETPPSDLFSPLYANLPDRPAFTFEGWFRAGDTGTARVLLNDVLQHGSDHGVTFVREVDGSLRAQISSSVDPRRVDLRSAPLELGTTWHHIALTRTEAQIAIYVDGASVAEGPAVPVTAPNANYSWQIGSQFGANGAWLGATDRFGVTELTAAVLRFAVDTTLPHKRSRSCGSPRTACDGRPSRWAPTSRPAATSAARPSRPRRSSSPGCQTRSSSTAAPAARTSSAGCPFAFRLPILHAGRHTLQARQRLAGTNTVITTDELAMLVTPSRSDTTIVGLQMALVVERGKALSRRAPRVRLALSRPACCAWRSCAAASGS